MLLQLSVQLPLSELGQKRTFAKAARFDNGLSLRVVSDNLHKGAALNTVQIAELIINRNLLEKVA